MQTNLGKALHAYEQKHDISGRIMAELMGMNKSTYCRIKQGKMPDAHTFMLIMSWLLSDK